MLSIVSVRRVHSWTFNFVQKKSKTTSNKSSKKIKSKEIIDENANSDEGSNGVPKEKKEKKKNTSKDQKSKVWSPRELFIYFLFKLLHCFAQQKSHHHGNTSTDGPVHITTHETVSIEEQSGLDRQVFLQVSVNYIEHYFCDHVLIM